MSFYPSKISESIISLENAGKTAGANAAQTNASFVCGSALRFTLRIEEKKIAEAKFQTNGCGYLIAAADLIAEIITNKELSELHALADLEQQIESQLGKFPENRKHCLNLAIETLHGAFNDFRAAKLEEFIGEKALICTCFGISEDTIEKIITENRCKTVEEVSQKCNAGSGCGSCQPLIQEIIDSNLNVL